MRRTFALIAALPLFTLAACGGAGPQAVGNVAPPAPTAGSGSGSGSSGGSGGGVATPTPTPGSGSPTTFLSVASATTFDAVGSFHSLNTDKKTLGELYQGHASTVAAPSGTIAYDPRDGYFTVTIADASAGVNHSYTFQDPAHRYSAATKPADVPTIDGFNYLVLSDADSPSSFFYQRPGTSTNYVTLAGFVRTADTQATLTQERGVMVFGQRTVGTQLPTSGSGTYRGGFLGSAVLDPAGAGSYLQWITGSSEVSVDFGTRSVSLGVTGNITQTFQNGVEIFDSSLAFKTGTEFKANGTATMDAIRSGSFAGEFQTATLGGTAIQFQRVSSNSATAGASSIDGAFYGPQAVNVGGNMRIIGGLPDQRVDIQGAFTGAVVKP